MSPTSTIDARYELEERLDQGGKVELWAARDLRLRREVAVKMLDPARTAGTGMRDRFEAEARSAARLTHPNIVIVYDRGEHEGRPFVVIERLPGRTLADEIAEGPVTPERAVHVAADVLAALQAASEAGIVHGDVNPANVFLCPDGSAKVAGFGMARDRTAGSGYAAPERREGRPATPRSDVYSVGVLISEALTGHLPGEGPSAAMAAARPELSAHVAAVVERALDRDPGRRFASAAEMAQALLAPPPTAAPDSDTQALDPDEVLPVAARPRFWHQHARRPLVVAGLTMLAVAAVVWMVSAGSGSRGSLTAPATTVAAQPLPPGNGPIPAGHYRTGALVPGLHFTVGDGWARPEDEAQDVLTLRRQQPGGPELSFLVVERVFGAAGSYPSGTDYIAPGSAEPAPRPLVDWLRRHPRLRSGDPTAADLEGVAATRIDIEVADGYPSEVCVGPCVVLFSLDAEAPKYRVVKLEQGRRMRLYVMEQGGQPVVVSVVAPSDGFERIAAVADAVVRTVATTG